MTDERAYRIHIHFEPDQGHFAASVPELGLSSTAKTRSELITAVEDAIEARIQEAASGKTLPAPIDTQSLPSTIAVPLSGGLARELFYQAKRDNLTPESLAAELIARGVGQSEARGPRRRRDEAAPGAPGESASSGDEQPADLSHERRDPGGDRGPPRRGRRDREGYRPELEDKANFLEYLRGLEKGPGQGGGGSGGGGRRGRR
ncbi:MAG: hypothetical protein IT384_22895 [Deltaproteobacteria bacterium]|nr:hypothetical protein [Deltaproteobacteria bacterium]